MGIWEIWGTWSFEQKSPFFYCLARQGILYCCVSWYPRRGVSRAGVVRSQSIVVGKNTMAEHHNSKLTQEQRREVGLLINAGVPRKLLATDYKVSIYTIYAIGRQRRRWIEQGQITTNKEQRFRYAQQLYPQLNRQLCKRQSKSIPAGGATMYHPAFI